MEANGWLRAWVKMAAAMCTTPCHDWQRHNDVPRPSNYECYLATSKCSPSMMLGPTRSDPVQHIITPGDTSPIARRPAHYGI
jgi:hypothetical protein